MHGGGGGKDSFFLLNMAAVANGNGVQQPHGNMARKEGRPLGKMSVGTWIRLHGIDLITMAAMGALGLGIYEAGA